VAHSARAALALWTCKEAVLKAAGGKLAELPAVRVRGRQVEFRGQFWHCRAPRLAPRVIACLATAQPVTRLRVRALSPAALSL
jgi:phosphopantetheinyl transferase